jgi:diacylglycerol kinase
MFIITLMLVIFAIFIYFVKQDINSLILILLVISLIHSIYLEIIDNELEEIIKALKDEGLVRDDEEND